MTLPALPGGSPRPGVTTATPGTNRPPAATAPGRHRRRWCGLTIDSALELPGLDIATGDRGAAGSADIRVELDHPAGRLWESAWTQPTADSAPFAVIGRNDVGEPLVRYDLPGSPVLRLQADDRRIGVSTTRPTEPRLALAVVNLGLPLLLSESGRTVLHAAAIDVGGHAIVVLGHSGTGKSTLGVRAGQRGATILTDDCVVLTDQGDDVSVIGSGAQPRLWEDSSRLLDIDAVQLDADGKCLVRPVGGRSEPRPLRSMLLLAPTADADPPRRQRLTPAERVHCLDEHLVWLGGPERARREEHLTTLARLADKVSIERLGFAHTLAGLDAALDLIA